MSDTEFRAFLNLLMCSDPWPGDETDHATMRDFAHKESAKRGYANWIDAFHGFKVSP